MAARLERPVHEPLGEGVGLGRAAGQAGGQGVGLGDERVGGHDPVGDAQLGAPCGGDVVGQEHELLRDLRTDHAGQQVGAAGVRDDASLDEHLDELGVLGHDDQVARQHELGATAGGRAVDRGDDRLLAVEDARDQALPAAADHPGGVAHGAVGRALGLLGAGLLRAGQVGAGAEVPLAGAGQHHDTDAQVGRGPVEAVRELVAHVGGERVAAAGVVDGDAGDAVGHLVADQFVGRRVAHLVSDLGRPGPCGAVRGTDTTARPTVLPSPHYALGP